MDDRQLEWVVRNRARRLPGEPVGEVLRRLRRRAPLKVPAWRPRVAEVVAETVDGMFREHAWIGGLRAGVLTFNVDDPSLAGVLRMQWHRPLTDVLAQRLPDLGVVGVRFRYEAPPQGSRPVPEEGAGDPEQGPPLWRTRGHCGAGEDVFE